MEKHHILVPIGESEESQHILGHIPHFFPPKETKLVMIQVTEEPDDPTDVPIQEENVPKVGEIGMPAEIAYETPAPKTTLTPEDLDVDDEIKPTVFTTQVEERHLYEVEDKLKEISKPLREDGYEVKTVVRFGEPAEEIVGYVDAEEEAIDLIAMTTHGRSGLDRLFKGSVAEDILRNTHLPILLVRAP